ncbi:MAG: matrixin family metalloprotease [Planctomycetes bacterium]|nr:matrixin family metalloprotease [Planctomycetota bacterium]
MIRSIVAVLSLAFLLIPSPLLASQLRDTSNALLSGTVGLLDELEDTAEDPLEPFRTFNNGWTNTASGTSGLGEPAVLTWSIVPNGTPMPGGLGEPRTPSNLISFLDSIHHGGASPGGSDLTQRDWFPLVESAYERWDQISGISMNYEPNDDGARVPGHPGILGRRGDLRLSGHSIDGQTSPTFLAYNFFPNIADMVIDTDEVIRWGNPEGNFTQFRFMLMHEIGHGLGLNHMTSADANFLMEPILQTGLDGPQLDDILGVHRLYGDVNEVGAGNEDYLNATSLGRFWPGQSKQVGSDATDTVVEFTDVDFLSIDDDSDVDYFRFTILTPSLIDFELTPLGPSYKDGSIEFNTATMSDLSLTLWDSDGTSILDFANDNGLGGEEQLQSVFLPQRGDYYVSVAGAQNAAQFYELGLDVNLPIPTDTFNFSDLIRDFFGRTGFGSFFPDSVPNIFSLPEPSAGLMMAVCCGVCAMRRRRATV